jgi:hypothetical protein
LNVPKIEITIGTAPWSRRANLSFWTPSLLHLVKISLNLLRNTLHKFPFNYDRRRDSIVGIATDYGLDDGGVGVRVPVGSSIFTSPRHPDRFLSPPSLLSNGYLGFFSRGVKRQGCEADHLSPTSAEDKKIWNNTSTPPYAFTA